MAISLKPLHATYLSFVLISIYVYFISRGTFLPLIRVSSLMGLPVWFSPFLCVLMGVLFSLIIGFLTDAYTADPRWQVKDNAFLSQYSSVLSIFNGIALGMKTVIIPMLLASVFIFIAYLICDYYGIILIGVGFASMLPVFIASSFSAPFYDMLSGVAMMENQDAAFISELHQLNSVGNTLSTVTKHAASYAVLFMSFSFFFSFVQISGINYHSIPLFHPIVMLSLFLGGIFPYAFVSILLRAISYIVSDMVEESRLQLQEIPYLKDKKTDPDLRRFIRVHGVRIIKDLIIPSIIIFFLPFLIGKFLSVEVLAAFLIGCIMVSTFLSISYTNTGALLGNAKKYIEKGFLGGKQTKRYANALEGDLFGDCLKDVLAPAINVLLKVVVLITIIFVPIII